MKQEQPNVASLQRELEFLGRLLAFQQCPDLQSLMQEAVDLAGPVCGAQKGYLRLWEPGRDKRGPAFSWGFSPAELQAARARVSSGVIAEARAEGQTINTVASGDPRFAQNESVRAMSIEAVLCVPIGGAESWGVLYLQGNAEGRGPFSPQTQERAERLALGLLGPARRLFAEQRLVAPDPTQEIRDGLQGAERFVGRSQATAEVLRALRRSARLREPVLLLGPSGSGKTTLARILHESSGRREGPFVHLNCANLNAELLEAELFGTKKGAFTGAVDRKGLLAQADGGTLFLDEVADLPSSTQAKLLRFLDDGRFTPLGDAREQQSDVRLVSATDQDLEKGSTTGAFRSALLFRLRRMVIQLPPLAERREDIAPLARSLVARSCSRNGLPVLELAPEAVRWLEVQPWPGNVRDLESALIDGLAHALDEDCLRIELRHLSGDSEQTPTSYKERVNLARKRILRQALAEAKSVSAAARELELSRSRLYELISELGIET